MHFEDLDHRSEVSAPQQAALTLAEHDRISCRRIRKLKEVLPADLIAAPIKKLQGSWSKICDVAYCIVLRSSSGLRWRSLSQALGEVGLLEDSFAVENDAPCGRDNCSVIEDRVWALYWSHLFAVADAKSRGARWALILEDDVYFDLGALDAFLLSDGGSELFASLSGPCLYLGGVYTSMRATPVYGVYQGRAMQCHAYVANVDHPLWTELLLNPTRSMIDVAIHESKWDSLLLYPATAFQRAFPSSGAASWPLHELRPLYRVLAESMRFLGITNCWEACSRATNRAAWLFGSIQASLSWLLGALVLLASWLLLKK